MNPTGNHCPYDYVAIRGISLDFINGLGEVEEDETPVNVTFSDERDGDLRKFTVQVYNGPTELAFRMYGFSYTEGQDTMELFSYYPVPEFDGYIDLRDRQGNLSKILRVVHHNASLNPIS